MKNSKELQLSWVVISLYCNNYILGVVIQMGIKYKLYTLSANGIIDYLINENIPTKSDTTTSDIHIFHFTVTSDGEIKNITFDSDDTPYATEITAALESIPHEELNTLSEDWIFHMQYIKQGDSQKNRLYFFYYE